MNIKDLPKQFQGLGLRLASTPKYRRLVLGVEASAGCGKSGLILGHEEGLIGAPRPLLHINLDKDLEGIEERYVGDDIVIYDVEMPDTINKEEDLKQFFKVRKLVFDAMDSAAFRTVSIDTGDALWELCRRGFIGSLDFGATSNQSDFTEPNGAMRRIFRRAKDNRRVNLVVTHRLTEERKDGISNSGKKTSVPTGKMRMSGWKHTIYEVQCHVRLDKEEGYVCDKPRCKKECSSPETHSLNRFTCTITKCTANTRAEGQVLRGQDISFTNIAILVFPKTADTPEVWE